MFKYTKRLIANIKFYRNEWKLQEQEYQEQQHIEGYTGYTISGFAYY